MRQAILDQMSADNGFQDRITIFRGLSIDFRPSAKADVIISDLRGHLPFFESHIPTIVDARKRLLKPGGTLIPASDTIRIALVHSPSSYTPCEEPWLHNKFALDLSAGDRFAKNDFSKVRLDPSALLCEPVDLAIIDYYVIIDAALSNRVDLVAEASGTAHGLLLWFDAELAPGLGFSNAPGEPEQVYHQTFFPFERPIDLAAGDKVEVWIRANLVEGTYVWSWASKVWRIDAGWSDIEYRQSTFLGRILSLEKLARRSSKFVPRASSAHDIDRHCLSLFDGKSSLSQIADGLATAFPNRFKDSVAALTHVTSLAERYHDNAPPASIKDSQ